MTRYLYLLAAALLLTFAAGYLANAAHGGARYRYDLGDCGTPPKPTRGCAGPATEPSPGPCVELNSANRGLVDAEGRLS